MELKALEMETAPLRGLDKRVVESRDQIKQFYTDRIPGFFSAYAPGSANCRSSRAFGCRAFNIRKGKPGPELTEIFLDASITGDYPQIMHFVNSLERDKTFFVVRADVSDRPAGRPGQPAPPGFHLDAERRGRGQRPAPGQHHHPAQAAQPAGAAPEGE